VAQALDVLAQGPKAKVQSPSRTPETLDFGRGTLDLGAERLLIAFEVVVLGGLGSFWGALLGGIALGMAQLIGLKIDPNAGLLYAHLLFFCMLLIRPSGLVSSKA